MIPRTWRTRLTRTAALSALTLILTSTLAAAPAAAGPLDTGSSGSSIPGPAPEVPGWGNTNFRVQFQFTESNAGPVPVAAKATIRSIDDQCANNERDSYEYSFSNDDRVPGRTHSPEATTFGFTADSGFPTCFARASYVVWEFRINTQAGDATFTAKLETFRGNRTLTWTTPDRQSQVQVIPSGDGITVLATA